MADDDAKLIKVDFQAATPPAGGHRIVRTSAYCGHRGTRDVDPNNRTVTCARCKALLDPFECLLDTARAYEHRTLELAELDRKMAAARKELDELQRLERNARARLRRAETACRSQLATASLVTQEDQHDDRSTA